MHCQVKMNLVTVDQPVQVTPDFTTMGMCSRCTSESGFAIASGNAQMLGGGLIATHASLRC